MPVIRQKLHLSLCPNFRSQLYGAQWSAWSPSFTVTAPIDTGPVVNSVSNITTVAGQSFAASSLFTASDPFGDAITQYDFWNAGTHGGHFALNGATLGANQDDTIDAVLDYLWELPHSDGDYITVVIPELFRRPSLAAAFLRRTTFSLKRRLLSEPGIVITDVALQRAAYPMDLVDLDAGPGGRAKAYQQPHGPAVIFREIEEGWIVCATDHGRRPLHRVLAYSGSCHVHHNVRKLTIAGGRGAREPLGGMSSMV